MSGSLLLDLVYPRNCVGCGVVSPEPMKYLCWDCFCDTPRVEPPFCSICGDPVAGTIEHDYVCFSCFRQQPAFDAARSAVRYDGAVGSALRELKYHHALWVAMDLAALLEACVKAEYPDIRFDTVVPVPLFPARYRERGFNQSAAIGAQLARRLGTGFSPRMLRRIRPTVSQTGLTAALRAANVNGAFKTGWALRPEDTRILLVDDVMTTGATVNACAAALKKGGARSVHVITVARG